MKTAIPLPVVEMVGEFMCPGCTLGCKSTMDDCGKIEQQPNGAKEGGSWTCNNHSAGTMMAGIGKILLGMPKGFNRVGFNTSSLHPRDHQHNPIRLWTEMPPEDHWDNLNVPVWAMEYEGHLLVRTYCPRINVNWTDVVKGGTRDLVPNAINVAEFVDEID